MRLFSTRVLVESPSGEYLYRTHAAGARLMVENGAATIASRNGKVRSIKLTKPTTWFAQRLGEPSVWSGKAQPFTRKVRTENGTWVEFHPRSFEVVDPDNSGK